MVSIRLGAPEIDTVPTPPIRAIGFTTLSSKILYKPGVLSSAVTERRRIGIASAPNLNNIGLSQLSGRVCFTISSLSRTSFVATSISMPYSNSKVTIETFSLELELICLRSLTLLRVFSKGLVTLFSISEAFAPW